MTTVYLIRHSKPLKVNNDFNKDSLQLRNEKEVTMDITEIQRS